MRLAKSIGLLALVVALMGLVGCGGGGGNTPAPLAPNDNWQILVSNQDASGPQPTRPSSTWCLSVSAVPVTITVRAEQITPDVSTTAVKFTVKFYKSDTVPVSSTNFDSFREIKVVEQVVPGVMVPLTVTSVGWYGVKLCYGDRIVNSTQIEVKLASTPDTFDRNWRLIMNNSLASGPQPTDNYDGTWSWNVSSLPVVLFTKVTRIIRSSGENPMDFRFYRSTTQPASLNDWSTFTFLREQKSVIPGMVAQTNISATGWYRIKVIDPPTGQEITTAQVYIRISNVPNPDPNPNPNPSPIVGAPSFQISWSPFDNNDGTLGFEGWVKNLSSTNLSPTAKLGFYDSIVSDNYHGVEFNFPVDQRQGGAYVWTAVENGYASQMFTSYMTGVNNARNPLYNTDVVLTWNRGTSNTGDDVSATVKSSVFLGYDGGYSLGQLKPNEIVTCRAVALYSRK